MVGDLTATMLQKPRFKHHQESQVTCNDNNLKNDTFLDNLKYCEWSMTKVCSPVYKNDKSLKTSQNILADIFTIRALGVLRGENSFKNYIF